MYIYRNINSISGLTDINDNLFIGDNYSNTSEQLSTLSACTLNSSTPILWQPTITQDISCGSWNIKIVQAIIGQNSYVNLWFTFSLDFN